MNKIKIHENALLKSQNYKRAAFELLEAIEFVEKEKVYYLYQRKSLYDYCMKDLLLSEDVAMMFIGIMRKSKTIPELKQAIKEQKINISNARKIAPILTIENQAYWIQEAEESSDQLKEKLAQAFPERIKKETVKTISEEYVSITIRVKKTDFEIIKRAKEIQSKKAKRVVPFEETIVETAKTYIEKNDPVEKANRAMNKKTKKDSDAPPEPELEPVPIQVDSQSASIPAAHKHFVNKRDQGQCQHKNPDGSKCLSRFFTEIHHIKPRFLGGSHDPSNLITLCSGHHKAHHFNENLKHSFVNAH